jgi:hypothetical protein
MSDRNTVAIYKIGDKVQLRFAGRLIGAVTEVREPMAPSEQVRYSIRIPMDPEPLWLEVRQDEVDKV